jgi:hypothetical protein
MTFESKGQFIYHIRNCKDSGILQLPHGKVVVKRGDDGMFMCHCTHSDCPRPFRKIESLKKHIKRAGTKWKTLECNQVSSTFTLSCIEILMLES